MWSLPVTSPAMTDPSWLTIVWIALTIPASLFGPCLLSWPNRFIRLGSSSWIGCCCCCREKTGIRLTSIVAVNRRAGDWSGVVRALEADGGLRASAPLASWSTTGGTLDDRCWRTIRWPGRATRPLSVWMWCEWQGRNGSKELPALLGGGPMAARGICPSGA